MPRRSVALFLAVFAAVPASAADREVIRTDCAGFERQVAARKLEGRAVRVRLSGGGEAKTSLVRVVSETLIVRATRATRQWRSSGGEAAIPRQQVLGVQFTGRSGHSALIGTLAGLGGGAAIGAAIATQSGVNEGWGIILIPLAGAGIAILGGVAGYLIGRSVARSGPEFVITR